MGGIRAAAKERERDRDIERVACALATGIPVAIGCLQQKAFPRPRHYSTTAIHKPPTLNQAADSPANRSGSSASPCLAHRECPRSPGDSPSNLSQGVSTVSREVHKEWWWEHRVYGMNAGGECALVALGCCAGWPCAVLCCAVRRQASLSSPA